MVCLLFTISDTQFNHSVIIFIKVIRKKKKEKRKKKKEKRNFIKSLIYLYIIPSATVKVEENPHKMLNCVQEGGLLSEIWWYGCCHLNRLTTL